MNYHSRYAGIVQPVETCLVGGGAFGQSLLAQARFIRRLSVRIVVDLSGEAAAAAFVAAGLPKADIRICDTAAEARAAWDAGRLVAAGSVETVIGLPFHILVEATGHPESAARHALAAIDSRRHVLLVTKETDSVAGPMLARLARDAGVLVAPVDGDDGDLLGVPRDERRVAVDVDDGELEGAHGAHGVEHRPRVVAEVAAAPGVEGDRGHRRVTRGGR